MPGKEKDIIPDEDFLDEINFSSGAGIKIVNGFVQNNGVICATEILISFVGEVYCKLSATIEHINIEGLDYATLNFPKSIKIPIMELKGSYSNLPVVK